MSFNYYLYFVYYGRQAHALTVLAGLPITAPQCCQNRGLCPQIWIFKCPFGFLFFFFWRSGLFKILLLSGDL